MKMRCECGELIIDQTDYLPYKASFTSDQDLFDVWDAIDKIVSEAATGELTVDDAQIAFRNSMRKASRAMYQCSKCGRLLVEDLKRKMNIYAPTSDADSRQILRSRD